MPVTELGKCKSQLDIGPSIYGSLGGLGGRDPHGLLPALRRSKPDTAEALLDHRQLSLMIDFAPELLQPQAMTQLDDLDRRLREEHSRFNGLTLAFSWPHMKNPSNGFERYEQSDVFSSFVYRGVPICGPYDASLCRSIMLTPELDDQQRAEYVRRIIWNMVDMHQTIGVIGMPMPAKRYDSPTSQLLETQLGAQFFEVPRILENAVFAFILAARGNGRVDYAMFYKDRAFRDICAQIYQQLHNVHFKQFYRDVIPQEARIKRASLNQEATRAILF